MSGASKVVCSTVDPLYTDTGNNNKIPYHELTGMEPSLKKVTVNQKLCKVIVFNT